MVLKKFDISLYLMMIGSGKESSVIGEFIKNIPLDVLNVINDIIDKNQQFVSYNGSYIGNDNNHYVYYVTMIPPAYFKELGLYLTIKKNGIDVIRLTLQPVKRKNISEIEIGDFKHIGSFETYKIDKDNKFRSYCASINYLCGGVRGIGLSRDYTYEFGKNYKYMDDFKLNVDGLPQELYQEDFCNDDFFLKAKRGKR